MSRAGYVLVGGRSSRMGRDKALLPFDGVSLAESVARKVELAAGNATLVGSPEVYGARGFAVIPDLFPGQGPLGGILSALDQTSGDWNLIVACDMPDLSVEFLGELLAAAGEQQADVLVPCGPSGRPEPLCAVYHRRSREVLQAAFADGIRKVTAAYSGLRIATLRVPEYALFHNVNTPEDWAAYGK